MLKYLVIICCCVCVTLVLSEVTAFAILWQRGILTPQNIREIRHVLSGAAPEPDGPPEIEQKPQYPSADEVASSRAVAILGLDRREGELSTLKGMADGKRTELEAQQQQFRAMRKSFEDELQKRESAMTSSAAEQARGVLLALPPKDAVRQLMNLSLEEDVVLLKGMPEKSIAKILKEFGATAPPPTTPGTAPGPAQDTPVERGRKIFEALSAGEPLHSLLQETRDKFETEGAESANSRGGE